MNQTPDRSYGVLHSTIPGEPSSTQIRTLGTLMQQPDGTRDLFREKFSSGMGMPKKDVADYAESQGILVPKRFESLQEAIDSGKDFIIRSEDPKEYAGMSGMYHSYVAEVSNDIRDDWFPFRLIYHDILQLQAIFQENPNQDKYSLDYGLLCGVEFSGDELKVIPEDKILGLIRDNLEKKICFLDVNFPIKVSIYDESCNFSSEGKYDPAKNQLVSETVLEKGWNVDDLLILLSSQNREHLMITFYQDTLPQKVQLRGGSRISANTSYDELKQKIANYHRDEDMQDIQEELSIPSINYSFWEYIPGVNLAVCRDTVDKDAYYIYRQGDSWKSNNSGGKFATHDYGCIKIKKGEYGFPDYERYIELYEDVAQLSAFDRNNCPIIEMQESEEDKLYFLQTLPTQQSVETLWTLDRELENGEIEVGLVRGATGPEGIEVSVSDINTLKYNRDNDAIGFHVDTTDLRNLTRDTRFAKDIEAIASRATLGIIIYPRNGGGLSGRAESGNGLVEWVVGDHGGRSIMHKPKVTILIDDDIYSSLGIRYSQYSIRVRIISDGKKCFIKKLS